MTAWQLHHAAWSVQAQVAGTQRLSMTRQADADSNMAAIVRCTWCGVHTCCPTAACTWKHAHTYTNVCAGQTCTDAADVLSPTQHQASITQQCHTLRSMPLVPPPTCQVAQAHHNAALHVGIARVCCQVHPGYARHAHGPHQQLHHQHVHQPGCARAPHLHQAAGSRHSMSLEATWLG
jgi:hypothetical protein